MSNRSSLATGWCEVHGKLLYANRKTAKKAARSHVSHKNEFPCTEIPALWHIGELPAVVIRGEVTRDSYFRSVS